MIKYAPKIANANTSEIWGIVERITKMKLFIRTQDKTALEEVNEVHLDELRLPNRKTQFSIVANYHLIGKYPTRKRCLEVIDEIEARLSQDVDFVLYTMPEK